MIRKCRIRHLAGQTFFPKRIRLNPRLAVPVPKARVWSPPLSIAIMIGSEKQSARLPGPILNV